MTKVEELREQLEEAVDEAEHDDGMEFAIWPIVDSLISVAHAEGVAEGRKEGITKGIARNAYEMGKHEGVAEGAEQMKAEIRKTGEFIKTDESMSGIEGDWASLDEHRGEIEGMSARCDLFIVKASVLAPTKEGK